MMIRDYKKEYERDQKKRVKYRAALNKINRDKGTYGNGDGLDNAHIKDVRHKGLLAGATRAQPQSQNRAWRKGKTGYDR